MSEAPLPAAPRRALLAVNARDAEELRVVRAEGGRIVDLRWSRRERGSLVGAILLGTVTRIEDGLDAAFVDLGLGRAGFLHRGQLHPALADPALDPVAVAERPAPRGDGGGEHASEDADEDPAAASAALGPKLGAMLRPGRRLLVQVLRDPLRQKGATLTTFLSLAGHRLVFMPSLGRPGVSRRVEDPAERLRLRAALAEIAGPAAGVIARTSAEGVGARELAAEWSVLRARWEALAARARHQAKPGPLCEVDEPAVTAAGELLGTGVGRFVVDDAAVADRLRAAFGAAAGAPTVEFWSASRPLFEALDLERDWQSLFRPRVPLAGGGSIVIHETEALTAVDVNSGPTSAASLEETALQTNLAACAEIARQTRLRDLGGIMVVDFIDMRVAEHRRSVEAALREELRGDRARMKVGHLGSFGLMAFTRRRVGGGLPRALESLCRGCGGGGHVAHHHAGALRALRRMRAEAGARAFRVRAQPGTCAALRGAALADAVAALGHPLELVEDLQVSAGDPVVQPDLLAGPGAPG